MKKYKVTQEFMDSLEDWRDKFVNGKIPVNALTYETNDNVVEFWRFENFGTGEFIQRLGALLNWINGEEVFEVGTPKYVVKRKEVKSSVVREYLKLTPAGNIQTVSLRHNATRCDDFGKASEWANAHFEVVEVDE